MQTHHMQSWHPLFRQDACVNSGLHAESKRILRGCGLGVAPDEAQMAVGDNHMEASKQVGANA